MSMDELTYPPPKASTNESRTSLGRMRLGVSKISALREAIPKRTANKPTPTDSNRRERGHIWTVQTRFLAALKLLS